eukprot:1140138-Pelagomonas_calceolata.AAC.3
MEQKISPHKCSDHEVSGAQLPPGLAGSCLQGSGLYHMPGLVMSWIRMEASLLPATVTPSHQNQLSHKSLKEHLV